jgi:hypothetical protein
VTSIPSDPSQELPDIRSQGREVAPRPFGSLLHVEAEVEPEMVGRRQDKKTSRKMRGATGQDLQRW